MFRRAFWFTTGAAAGVWATTKVQRKIRSSRPTRSRSAPPTRPSKAATG